MKNGFRKMLDLVSDFIASDKSINVRNGTVQVNKDMDNFLNASREYQNKPFEQTKGNLFEYIEAAKFNKNAANQGENVRAVVTDSIKGRSHDPADIELVNKGKVVREIQAKFSKTIKPNGVDNSAATSVFEQAGGQKGHWGKYAGMSRLIRKEENYNENGSLLDEAKKIANARAESNGIYSEHYKDVYNNLDDELRYNNITSGGTTYEETELAYNNPERYSQIVERNQWKTELSESVKNGAVSSGVMTGVVSGISNTCSLLKNEKNFDEAVRDTFKDSINSAARGASVGGISSALHIVETQKNIDLSQFGISDATVNTVLAGCIVDCGVSIYSYSKGEISAEQLKEEIVNTTVKSTATVFITKGLNILLASSGGFVPIIAYSVASQMVISAREIIKNAELNVEEYNRITELLKEAEKSMLQYQEKVGNELSRMEAEQRRSFCELLNNYSFDVRTGQGYEQTVKSIVSFANQTGMPLQYADYDEFCNAMSNGVTIRIK